MPCGWDSDCRSDIYWPCDNRHSDLPIYWLSRRRDGSHHHEWDLLWARSPICERHIWWQIWHSKLLVGGGPDLCRSRLDSSSWMRRVLNFPTADLHEEHQSALSINHINQNVENEMSAVCWQLYPTERKCRSLYSVSLVMWPNQNLAVKLFDHYILKDSF